MPNSKYNVDFYGWASEQASLLRAGHLSAADIENIAEEIESMGRGEKRELVNRLTVLLKHMLKWKFQPKKRTSSWQASVQVQRNGVRRHLVDNPSLRPLIPAAIGDAYEDAALEAVAETKLSRATFPASCEWSFDQLMDSDFWPN